MRRARRVRRRIAVITGTRAEYGLLRSPMEAIARHARLDLRIVVTGMHLLRKFGTTVNEIVRDGWEIDARVRMQKGDDDVLDQANGLARGVSGIARFLHEDEIDVVVVLGDRVEAMAGALAGVTAGCIVAHIHGGDVAPGDFDDSFRHAITKLAHVHLAATQAARSRIIQMGEPRQRAHCVGAPGLDRLLSIRSESGKARQSSGYAIVIQHPCGRSAAREHRVMRMILRSVDAAGLYQTIIYPNSDRGHTGILIAIDEHRQRASNGSVRVERSIDRDQFLRMLIESDVIVGNSSSGIIEAGAAGTPTVNIGLRQRGRERGGRSVIDAEESATSIRQALSRAVTERPITRGRSVYGNGHAGERIADILASVPLDDAYRRKVSLF